MLLAEKAAPPPKGLAKRRKNEYTNTYDSAVGRGAGVTEKRRFLRIFQGPGAFLYLLREMEHKERNRL